MKWQKFEDKIGQRLFQHQPGLDVDELWAAIEPGVDQINKKNKKRRAWFWLFLIALPISVSCIGAFYFKELPYTKAQHAQTAATSKHYQKAEITASKKSPFNSNHTSNVKPPTNEQNEQHNDSAPIRLSRSSIIKSTQRLKAYDSDVIAPKSHLQSSHTEVEVDEMLSKVRETASSESFEGNDHSTQWHIASLATRDIKSIDYTPNVQIPRTDCWTYKKANWFLLLETGIGYADRQLEPINGDSLYTTLAERRNNTETQLETTQAGLFLSRINKKGIEISAGVNYTQINERFNYENVQVNVEYEYGIEAFVMNNNNGVDTIYGLIPTEKITTQRIIHFNKYRLVDIPLIIGYHRPLTNSKGSLGIRAGVFTNVLLQTEGKILGSGITDMNTVESDVYKSRIGFSYYLGLSLNYPINNRLSLSVVPSMRYFPDRFTNDNYALKQTYQLYSLKGGLRYQLSK